MSEDIWLYQLKYQPMMSQYGKPVWNRFHQSGYQLHRKSGFNSPNHHHHHQHHRRRYTVEQQQPFYGPLIQDNPGEPVPETIRHINPTIITILHSTSNQSSPFTTNKHLLSLTSNSSYPPPLLPSMFSLVSSGSNTFNHKVHTFLHPLTIILS